jgi:hypothetical protein
MTSSKSALVLLVLALVALSGAFGQQKYALVIGNAAYTTITKIR